MKLKSKKMVFAGLCLITVGATVGGVFITPIFALAGTALIGTIAVGKMIVNHQGNHEHQAQSPQQGVTPNPNPNDIQPAHSNLSPPSLALTNWVEEKTEELAKPAMGRDFSMHIQYQTNQHSPGGTQSPDAINVSVHTRSPGSATPPTSHHATPEGEHRRLPSAPPLTRKLTLPGDY